MKFDRFMNLNRLLAISLSCFPLTSCLVLGQSIDSVDAVPTESANQSEIIWKTEAFSIIFVDLTRNRIDLLWKDSEGNQISSLEKAETYVEETLKRKFIFATNAGMFKPDASPVGLHIESGKTLVPLDTKAKAPGNFYLKPNGIFFIDTLDRAGVLEAGKFVESYPIETWEEKMTQATQSGPMLVIDGEIHPAFNESSVNQYVRSGVGITGPQSVVFAISKNPVNFHTFASLFRDLLRCQNALYLDGAVSKFHAPDTGLRNPGGQFGGILVVSDD